MIKLIIVISVLVVAIWCTGQYMFNMSWKEWKTFIKFMFRLTVTISVAGFILYLITELF